ncbi:CPBP family intramembrane glutamic endopeptidase [Pelagibacterium halotolerans]|uniref:Abortive infection protein n=1 Tax=Pelagibacterium halotolerans (strain DSM 22347 / JCM 15775 / CGMCC 1.7692 / B2) TaxID=1082931 RepID=G4R6D4_PELHB|nr:CPBP family intramembrane glutamic endopeptidase [Pelagibacterium halotolerans]AEQ53199.1 abortive infection protein [Pelagibacterium halotolerans B2]QJR17163.1 CPBP family intramembrane metalloprotease [Pelagibacterium halotolerans]
MSLTSPQIGFISAGIALTLVLAVMVPTLTPLVPPFAGYGGTLVLYWVGFCLPVFFIFVPAHRRRALFSLTLESRDRWIPFAIGVQVLAVAIGAFVPVVGALTLVALAIAGAMALVNGVLEEAAWRGTVIEVFADRPVVGFAISWVLFTLWHVPLAMAAGTVYPSGPAALIGGAAGLGLFWSLIAWRTRAIGWISLAHVGTNFFAFSALNVENGWV